MKCIKKSWFTFVELVISITIIAILSVLWFISYSKYLEDSRDSQRKSELAWVWAWLKSHKSKRWDYPNPWDFFEIKNWAITVALQWKLTRNIVIDTVDNIPYDPYIKLPYTYSITNSKQEFQLATTLENNWAYAAYLIGDYQSVSKNVLPTISLSVTWSTDISVVKDKFIFDNSIHNIPYTFSAPYEPYSDWTTISASFNDTNVIWSQNWDYRSCDEIKEASKFIWNWTYQINSWWTLIDTVCN